MMTRGNNMMSRSCAICGLAVGLAMTIATAQAQVLVYEQTHDGTSSDDEARPTSLRSRSGGHQQNLRPRQRKGRDQDTRGAWFRFAGLDEPLS